MEELRKPGLYIVERNSGSAAFLQSPFFSAVVMFRGFSFCVPHVLGDAEYNMEDISLFQPQMEDKGPSVGLFSTHFENPSRWRRSEGHIKAADNPFVCLLTQRKWGAPTKQSAEGLTGARLGALSVLHNVIGY